MWPVCGVWARANPWNVEDEDNNNGQNTHRKRAARKAQKLVKIKIKWNKLLECVPNDKNVDFVCYLDSTFDRLSARTLRISVGNGPGTKIIIVKLKELRCVCMWWRSVDAIARRMKIRNVSFGCRKSHTSTRSTMPIFDSNPAHSDRPLFITVIRCLCNSINLRGITYCRFVSSTPFVRPFDSTQLRPTESQTTYARTDLNDITAHTRRQLNLHNVSHGFEAPNRFEDAQRPKWARSVCFANELNRTRTTAAATYSECISLKFIHKMTTSNIDDGDDDGNKVFSSRNDCQKTRRSK